MVKNKERKGLGGWLAIVGLGVVGGPIQLAYSVLPMYYDIFTDGTWEDVTTEGSASYNSIWGPFLIFELTFNVVFMLFGCYLIYLYFTKHHLLELQLKAEEKS